MRCPLCGGPVQQHDDHRLLCEVGHEVSAHDVADAAEARLTQALWMAIEALDNEARMLRALGGDSSATFADDAEQQAALLREFAQRHAAHLD